MVKLLTIAIISTVILNFGTVRAETPAGVYIAPGNVGMRAGSTWIFKIFADNPNGKTDIPLLGSVNWSIDMAAGTIDSSGVFHAGNTPGVYYLRADTSYGKAVAQIEIFTPQRESDYKPLCWWGDSPPGTLGGAFGVHGIAVDSSGNVYVADTNNNRIQKFDSVGNFILSWGSRGDGNGQFFHPYGIAVDVAGSVYVTDTGNHRVQKFDSSGHFITVIARFKVPRKKLHEPLGIAIDSSGNFYVAESYNHCIMKYDSAGRFVQSWGSRGEGDGQFARPAGVAVDSSGSVYVADSANNRIQKFDSSGKLINKWGSTWKTASSVNGQMNYPEGVAVDDHDNVYVADCCNSRIQKFDSMGNFLIAWSCKDSLSGESAFTQGIAVDATGSIYVVDSSNCHIKKFDSAGNYITSWGRPNSVGCGHFALPYCVAVGPSHSLYITDHENNRVLEFDWSGSFIKAWGSKDNSTFCYPRGVAVGFSGSIYVSDANGYHKLNPHSKSTENRRVYDQDDGLLGMLKDLLLDPRKQTFTLKLQRLQKLKSTGEFTTDWDDRKFGNPTSELMISARRSYYDGWIDWPMGIAIDSRGNAYVPDTEGNRIRKFDSFGRCITMFGSEKGGSRLLLEPRGTAVDPLGNIYVADTGNNRIVKFAPPTEIIDVWETLINGQFNDPLGTFFYDYSDMGRKRNYPVWLDLATW